MNLRKLKKELGKRAVVSREGRSVVRVEACGLGYRASERAFGSELEMADYVKSKMPGLRVGNSQ